jgi:hypothetical protein
VIDDQPISLVVSCKIGVPIVQRLFVAGKERLGEPLALPQTPSARVVFGVQVIFVVLYDAIPKAPFGALEAIR